MPFHHIGLPVGNHYVLMRDFYLAALKPLGYSIAMGNKDGQHFCGFAAEGSFPDFWLGLGDSDKAALRTNDGNVATRVAPFHLAFSAKDRQQVDEWYTSAIGAGAKDYGKPGERPFSAGYYAAFVLDPLGNNIEVMHLS